MAINTLLFFDFCFQGLIIGEQSAKTHPENNLLL